MSLVIEHHKADLGDVSLHYLLAGNGEPLVLLHGWPQSSHEWLRLMPYLADNYQLIVPDLRGLGDSSKPHTGYDKATIAADIYGLVHDQLGHDTIRLVGHDWGGGVAYAIAGQYRDWVSQLAILEMVMPGVPLPGAGELLGSFWHMSFHGVRDLPEALIQGRERTYISWFFNNFAYNPAAITPGDLDEYERCISQPGALRAGFEYYRARPEDAVAFATAAQQKLTIPVLALGGATCMGDAVKLCMEQVAESVIGGSIAECGHWIPEEQPEQLANQLKAFFG
ncbi:MAG: alpha/beta fold hydrolase [Immundisolibacteraceae bacterium]|nr:alpha/beta fold hydrolase [Immundisolibacteraceae bacterium]